jgi:hypothetical protein
MKTTNISVLALLGLSALLGTSAVQAESPAKFLIPFGFTAGTQSFSAGIHRVPVAPQVLHLEGENGHANMIAPVFCGEPSKNGSRPSTPTFRRYCDRYFLSQWAGPSVGIELRKSDADKETIAKLGEMSESGMNILPIKARALRTRATIQIGIEETKEKSREE